MAEKKKGFDLAAALGDVSKLNTGVEGREQIEYIHIGHIIPDERNFYELSGIDELAASIEFAGLQQHIRVRPGAGEGSYIIVSGHRRHAALTQLTSESPELFKRFSQVPCIVERPSGQTSEVEAMLQELKLIYGNSDTRRMSSADISKQAERVEILLYQLKEAGVEFPGKMRDHVAEACKVSASKLARLKVIREKLAPDIKKLWEKGKLKEAAAYVFAQNDHDVQMMVFAQLKKSEYNSDPQWWYEHEVKNWAEKIKRENKLKCTCGYCDKCDNAEKRLERIRRGGWDDHCRDGGKCCHGCPNLASCKSACPHLADEILAAKAKRKEEKAKEKAALVERNRPDVEQITELWVRFAQARTLAGKSMEEYVKAAGIYTDEATKKRWPEQEKGKKITRDSGLPYSGGHGTSLWDVRRLRKAADVLGCSLDYLLCRTDEPQPVASTSETVISFEKPQWNTGTPGVIGSYYCQVDIGGDRGKNLLYGSYWWNGESWLFKPGGADINFPVVGWWPLPDAGWCNDDRAV